MGANYHRIPGGASAVVTRQDQTEVGVVVVDFQNDGRVGFLGVVAN